MAIRFSCTCGQSITARSDFAGRRVQCNACKKVLTVPGKRSSVPTKLSTARPEPPATVAPPPAPLAPPVVLAPQSVGPLLAQPVGSTIVRPSAGATMNLAPEPRTTGIRFRCVCGADYQARPEHAGEPARCPRCGEVLFIPTRAAASLPGRPVLAARNRADQFAPKKDRGALWARLAIAAVVVLLLGAGGYSAWAFYFKDMAKTVRHQQDVGGGALGLVPANAVAFLSVHLGDAWNLDAARKLRQAPPPELVPFFKQIPEMEAALGLKIADVDRVVAVVPRPALPKIQPLGAPGIGGQPGRQPLRGGPVPGPSASAGTPWVAVELKEGKSVDPKSLRRLLLGANDVEHAHAGKQYFTSSMPNRPLALSFVSRRVFVVASEEGMQAFVGQKRSAKGPLRASIDRAADKSLLVLAVAPPKDAMRKIGESLPPQFAGFKPLLDLKVLTLVSDIQGSTEHDRLFLDYDVANKAADVAAKVRALLTLAKFGLAAARDKVPEDVSRQVLAVLNKTEVSSQGSVVQLTTTYDVAKMMAALKPALEMVNKVREAAALTQAQNNVKQILLALIDCADATGLLPTAGITDPTGRPLHSWRVAVLPYLGAQEKALYDKIRRTEPWDSQFNRQFHNQMPRVFEVPYAAAPAGQTFLQGFSGPGTPFPGKQGIRYPAAFTDGTSNTVLIVEANQAVPWMAPRDIAYSAQVSPLLQIGHHLAGGTLVGMADGSVRMVPRTVSEATWRAVITPSGGEVLGADWGN